jgi:outer membrane protein TolC
MLSPHSNSAARLLAVIAAAGVLSVGSWAQEAAPSAQPAVAQAPLPAAPQPAPAQAQQFTFKDYSKPRAPFPNVIAPYRPQEVPPANPSNTPRIEQFLQNGKLMLSMDDAVALALENNLDIAISRYNLNIADTDILRAKAGDSILGVNAGVVQNTPGGGTGGLSGTVGSGVGGTSVGSAGIGSGTNGLVNSTLGIGAPITSFDPILSGTLQFDHDSILSSSAFSAPVTAQNTTTTNFSYLQGFTWGTDLSLGFNNSRLTTNSPFSALSPNLGSSFQFKLTQSLLQGFGFVPNTRFIRIAKNNREITDVAFRLQVITTVDQVENIYWDLVYAYQNVKVQEEAVAFAQKTLEDNKKQVQAGTLPPIQVVSAENTVATDQQSLILAQTNLQLQQLLMKNALTRTLDDPVLAEAEVIPTSTMQLPAQEPVVPTRDLINDALSHRAELSESRIDLTNREINNKVVRNAMLPTLDLFAYYGGSGLGGAQNPANVCAPPPQPQAFGCHAAGRPAVSYASTLSDLVDSTAPDKGIGLTLNIPLRNRAAQANQVRAELEYRQAQLRLQQIKNQVGIEVRNAQFALQQNRAAVRAAQAAVELARQTLDAEKKKLAAGVSNATAVLQNQSGLTTAESNLVSAMAAYEKSHVELDRATGLLLDHSGIVLADAQRGEVVHLPTVPNVTPRQDSQPGTPHSQTSPAQPTGN